MVGHYRVVSAIGAGGMGTVYQGLDTRLNRPVAMKAIADRRKDDATAIRRLRAEALSAAALDHPYICKIYELVETDTETLIVMEFVEGETLAARLKRGPIPAAEALHLASEIAEGLANAHAHGMVHRDVKPGNVMVTPHGHVKLLDFGLAQTAMSGASVTKTTTGDPFARAGTPAYMSPEQVVGRPVSTQSDLFSFGVLLFECLTGQTPFDGDDSFSLSTNIVSAPPKKLEALAPDTPAAAVAIVNACLAKEPASRPAAAAVAADLKRLAEQSVSGAQGLAAALRAPWGFKQVAVVAVALAGAGLAAAWAIREWRSGGPASVLREQQLLVGWPSEESESRISPDGKLVSFLSTSAGGATRIFAQAVGGGNAQQVEVPEGEVLSHVWSPDGNEIACAVRNQDVIHIEMVPAPFGGGARARIRLDKPDKSIERLRLLRWVGTDLYYQAHEGGKRGVSLGRVSLGSRGVAEVSAAWKISGDITGITVSPDATRAAYTVLADRQEDLWVINLDGTGARRLTNDAAFDRHPLWTSNGQTVLYQSNRGGQIDLWEASAADDRTWPITSSQTEERPNAVSADGSVLTYEQYSNTANLWAVDPMASGGVQISADAMSDYFPALAQTGTTLVFQRARTKSGEGLAFIDSQLMKGTLTGTVFNAEPDALAPGFAPKLSPDGRRLAFLTRPPGVFNATLHARNLESGNDVVVSENNVRFPGHSQGPPIDWVDQTFAWSADSSQIWFIERGVAGDVLRRYRTGDAGGDAGLDPAAHAQLKKGEVMRDVYPASDGRRVAYLRGWPKSTEEYLVDLHVVEPEVPRDTLVLTTTTRLYLLLLRGWTDKDESLVLVRRPDAGNDDGSDPLVVSEVTVAGQSRPLMTIDSAFHQTLRLDAPRRTIFVTRSDAGVHNLYAVPLGTGQPRRLTTNQVTGVSFSGVARASSGGIVFVRDETKRDIYISRIGK